MSSPKTKDSILVVDDSPDFLDQVSALLTDEGYEVDIATSAREALEKSEEKIYSVAIISLELLDREGSSLLGRLENTDPRMRKVIVATHEALKHTKQALDLGADSFLVRPVDPEELLETVRKQLAEREKEFKERYVLLEDSGENS